MILAFMHMCTNPHTSDWALAKYKTAFKLPGFRVQSHKILFHVANKWIRQARRKRGGWKMSMATLKPLLISHACVSDTPLRPAGSHLKNKGDIDGAHFVAAQKLPFCFCCYPVIHLFCCYSNFKLCMKELQFPL